MPALHVGSAMASPVLEVTFPLLLLHAAGFVVVDDAALAFGLLGEEHFLDDFGEGGGGRLHGAGQGVAAEGAEADQFLRRFFAGVEAHALIVDHDEDAVAIAEELLDPLACSDEEQWFD